MSNHPPMFFFFWQCLKINSKPLHAAEIPCNTSPKKIIKEKPYRQSEETSVCVLQDAFFFVHMMNFLSGEPKPPSASFPRELPPGARGQSAAPCQPRYVTSLQTHTHARARHPTFPAPKLLCTSPRTRARVRKRRSPPPWLCACV